MKISVVITILNEEKTIEKLLNSLVLQTHQPSEVIIADGGSIDNTVQLIKSWQKGHQKFPLMLFIKKGNRSVGRNYAITQAKNEWIAITDAGCEPHKNWLKNLIKTASDKKCEVVAGYYQGIAKTNFQQAVIPYALVMSDKVNPDTFLPATRSMMMKKSVWEKLGGFDEELSDNEDYALAKKMTNEKVKICFANDAIVNWIPRDNFRDFLKMIYRFAKGDAFAGIFRPKVLLIFARYLFACGLLYLVYRLFGFWYLFGVLILIFGAYFMWSIQKNIKYVPDGWYYLPLLQIGADLAVMWGSVVGIVRRWQLVASS